MIWLAILAAAAGCFVLKLAGLSVPQRILDKPAVQRAAALLPVALLAALVGVQSVSSGTQLIVDARLAGVAAAIVALLLRAPFIVVVAVAALTAALVRLVF
jgi:branched-subunit amino acid transport protein